MMSSKTNNNWAILAGLGPCRYKVKESSQFPKNRKNWPKNNKWAILAHFSYRYQLKKKPKINPFVVKSLLESNCIHFGQSAIRENFNLKHGTQLKKTHSNNSRNYTHLYNEVKEKLWPVSSNYVWTIFEHDVKDMYASQKVQGFF